MAKDILLFGYISQYNAMFFFDQINEATEDNPDEELHIRVNTDGGEPEFMQSIMQKFQEIQAQAIFKGGPALHSAGFFAMCYLPAERVEVLDVTQALLHRAAYPDWIESASGFSGSPLEVTMIKTNKDLEKAMRARIDVDALEALPQLKERNIKLKNIFSQDGRVEVVLTGADLKKIGLAGKVNKITPSKQAAFESQAKAFAKCESLRDFKLAAAAANPPKVDEPKKENTIMNLAELKEKHPVIYAEAYNEGVKAGVVKEKDRVEAALVYVDVDPVGVKKIIESGEAMSAKQIAEFGRKMQSSAALGKLESEAAKEVETGSPAGATDEKTKKLQAFEADLDKSLGLAKK